jgi:hypothetical protein
MMWFLALLIIAAFVGAVVVLRFRNWRLAARPDTLEVGLAKHGFRALPVEWVGHERVARFIRDSQAVASTASGLGRTELSLANDGAATELVTLRVGGVSTSWIMARDELLFLLEKHPEVLAGDFTAVKGITRKPPSS